MKTTDNTENGDLLRNNDERSSTSNVSRANVR